jgi:hypothetical protein
LSFEFKTMFNRCVYDMKIKNLNEKGANENIPINPVKKGSRKLFIFINF